MAPNLSRPLRLSAPPLARFCRRGSRRPRDSHGGGGVGVVAAAASAQISGVAGATGASIHHPPPIVKEAMARTGDDGERVEG
ncbi:unnamed protein product [Lampetra planeri]